jgi:hypothetical protein
MKGERYATFSQSKNIKAPQDGAFIFLNQSLSGLPFNKAMKSKSSR